MHKHRPLSKMMSITFPDGYVLDSLGPFYADGKNNDSGMTARILEEDGMGITDWIKKAGKNTIILDRGFRNIVPVLESSHAILWSKRKSAKYCGGGEPITIGNQGAMDGGGLPRSTKEI